MAESNHHTTGENVTFEERFDLTADLFTCIYRHITVFPSETEHLLLRGAIVSRTKYCWPKHGNIQVFVIP